MISSTVYPKTKSELVRSIQSLTNPKFKVVEVFSNADQSEVDKQMKEWKRLGPYSVIFIKE